MTVGFAESKAAMIVGSPKNKVAVKPTFDDTPRVLSASDLARLTVHQSGAGADGQRKRRHGALLIFAR